MIDPLYLPVENQAEAAKLLDEIPMSLDGQRFVRFVTGFPRRYLVKTPRVDIVRHFLLMESRGDQPLASSLYREHRHWRLCVVTQDREYLFSNIAGALSCFGMSILSSEAFANADAVVLDTFDFDDSDNRFSSAQQIQDFQRFLELAVTGKIRVEKAFKQRSAQVCIWGDEPIHIEIDSQTHPSSTLVSVDFPDHFGHIFLASRRIADLKLRIDMAYVQTSGSRVRDDFYLSYEGGKLPAPLQETLKQKLAQLGNEYRRPALATS